MPLNATFNPADRAQQRVLNYSAIFDEVEDFDANVRNVSGPGALAAAVACQIPAPPPAPTTSTLDPNHGLLIGDNGDINSPPCVINNLAKPNAERQQVSVTLPGSGTAVPALTAMREWVKNQVRTPNGPSSRRSLRGGDSTADVEAGRQLFINQGCASCHGGTLWTSSVKDFTSPPVATDVFTETVPPPPPPTPPDPPAAPIGVSYINRFLRDIGSFNLGVAGANNPIGNNVGGIEKASQALNAAGVAGNAAGVAGAVNDALGFDFNGDGRGNGFSPPSMLGINAVPPYYHNGACETLACVVSNMKHRTANNTRPDLLNSEEAREQLVAFLRTISQGTPAP